MVRVHTLQGLGFSGASVAFGVSGSGFRVSLTCSRRLCQCTWGSESLTIESFSPCEKEEQTSVLGFGVWGIRVWGPGILAASL